MKIYLDENQTSRHLVALLNKAGHTVTGTSDAGLGGASDASQVTYAIQNGLVVLTRDKVDFRELHKLIITASGRHPGLMIVASEKDLSKRMKPKHIVTAIGNLERASFVMESQLVVLNQWR